MKDRESTDVMYTDDENKFFTARTSKSSVMNRHQFSKTIQNSPLNQSIVEETSKQTISLFPMYNESTVSEVNPLKVPEIKPRSSSGLKSSKPWKFSDFKFPSPIPQMVSSGSFSFFVVVFYRWQDPFCGR